MRNFPTSPAWYEVPQASSSDAPQPARIDLEPLQIGVVVLEQQTAAQGVGDGARLLVDLLEHEVRVAALLGLGGVPGDGARLPIARLPLDVGDHRLAGGDRHDVPFVEEDHLAGVLEDAPARRRPGRSPPCRGPAPAAKRSWRRPARPGACRRSPPARRRRAPGARPVAALRPASARPPAAPRRPGGRRSRCRSRTRTSARPPPGAPAATGNSR